MPLRRSHAPPSGSVALVLATLLSVPTGCAHHRADQYSYAPPYAPPVYPQPQAPGMPASATAPPSVVMPAAAAPVVGLPPGAVVAGAPQAPSLAADGVVHAVGGECPPCAGTGVDGVVMPAGVVVDAGQTPPCPPGP